MLQQTKEQAVIGHKSYKLVSTFKQSQIDSPYSSTLLDHFDDFYLTGPGLSVPTTENLQQYADGASYLQSKGKRVIGHSLFCTSQRFHMNKHLEGLTAKNQSQKELSIYLYLEQLLTLTKDTIFDWYVFNECSRRRNIAQVVFGDEFIDPIIEMIKDINPHLSLRINEYGYQNNDIIDQLIKLANHDSLAIGMQVYCSNPLFYIKLEQCLKRIRDTYPDKEIYLSEICVLDNSLLAKRMYKKILQLADKYNIREVGIWWPTDLYIEKCWSADPQTLWNKEMNKTKVYDVFFN